MICIHFQGENFKICEDKTGGQGVLSTMVYLYLAHIGCGFLLETGKDPGTRASWGECSSSQKGPDHPAMFLPGFRGRFSVAFFICHVQNLEAHWGLVLGGV